jgi:hypothetical protein
MVSVIRSFTTDNRDFLLVLQHFLLTHVYFLIIFNVMSRLKIELNIVSTSDKYNRLKTIDRHCHFDQM